MTFCEEGYIKIVMIITIGVVLAIAIIGISTTIIRVAEISHATACVQIRDTMEAKNDQTKDKA